MNFTFFFSYNKDSPKTINCLGLETIGLSVLWPWYWQNHIPSSSSLTVEMKSCPVVGSLWYRCPLFIAPISTVSTTRPLWTHETAATKKRGKRCRKIKFIFMSSLFPPPYAKRNKFWFERKKKKKKCQSYPYIPYVLNSFVLQFLKLGNYSGGSYSFSIFMGKF